MYPFPSPMTGAMAGPVKPQDVFSVMLQPASSMQAAISAFGPDLVIDKDRTAAAVWSWRSKARSTSLDLTLTSTSTAAEAAFAGYSGTNNRVAYGIKKAAGFYTDAVFTMSGTADMQIDLSSLGTVGAVFVKRLDAAQAWSVWHRMLGAGLNLVLNTTAAPSAANAYLSVSGTTLTVSGSMPNGLYLLMAFAHSEDPAGIIQCGQFRSSGTGTATVTGVPWRPQGIITKSPNTNAPNWTILDTARGWVSGTDRSLFLNTTAAESTANPYGEPTDDGFTMQFMGGNSDVPYILFREPY